MKPLKSKPGAKPRETEDVLSAFSEETSDLRVALDEHVMVAVTDPQGRITFVNDKCCAISKYSRGELLGQDHRMINSGYHPKELRRAIASGVVWQGEIKSRAKDGALYWVATTIVPSLDDQGKPRQFVAIGSDISEQKRIEAELAEKLRLQRLLADLSTRFVALQSEHVDAAIEETQQLIVETLRLDRCTLWQLVEHGPGLVCTHCWQVPGLSPLPPSLRTHEKFPWAQASIMRGEVICFSSWDELPPDAARDVETFRLVGSRSNATFPLFANGRVFGALAFATVGAERKWRPDEIAELKLIAQIIGNVVGRQRAEMREEELRNELAYAMRVASLGELAAALAHELNQPLAAILSNAQAALRFIAEGGIEPDELRAILDDIVRADKRAGSVIQNLRAMVSRRPAVRGNCDLNELVREVLELMHSEMIEAMIEVRPTLGPKLPFVEAASVELQQVLVNLLVNAVHAMAATPPELRVIEVETGAEAGIVVVTVRDRGCGVPPERLPVIFEPCLSTKASGLGMGLSICRRIIENHAGRIAARNHDDGGATFSFALPIPAGAAK